MPPRSSAMSAATPVAEGSTAIHAGPLPTAMVAATGTSTALTRSVSRAMGAREPWACATASAASRSPCPSGTAQPAPSTLPTHRSRPPGRRRYGRPRFSSSRARSRRRWLVAAAQVAGLPVPNSPESVTEETSTATRYAG